MEMSAVIPAVQALLESLPSGIAVVYDDYSRKAKTAMDDALLDGHCLAIKPLLSGKKTAQTGARVTELCNLTVHVRINPDKVAAGFNPYALHSEIKAKLCGDQALAAKAGTTDGDSFALLPEDLGLLSHALFFHVLVTNL